MMLPLSQTTIIDDFFYPQDDVALITQPVLGRRSRKKDKIDPKNETPQYEKKRNTSKSADRVLDHSLSTNLSRQSSQQKLTIVHPSTIISNEDFNTNHSFIDQPTHYQSDNLEKNSTEENISGHSENKNTYIQLLEEFYPDANLSKNESNQSSNAQYRLSDYLADESQSFKHRNIKKQSISRSKKIKNKRKLNIIVESTTPLLLSSVPFNDEQHSIAPKIVNSSSNPNLFHSKKLNYEHAKLKSTTTIFQHSDLKQIRTHVNRSVIERQHPTYVTMPQRKDVTQKMMPLNACISRVDHYPLRSEKYSTRSFYSKKDNNIGLRIDENHEEVQNQKENYPTTARCYPYKHVNSFRSNQRQLIANNFLLDQTDNKIKTFHTKTTDKKGRIRVDFERQQIFSQSVCLSKPRFVTKNDNQKIHSNTGAPSEYSDEDAATPFQLPPIKLFRTPYTFSQIETTNLIFQTKKPLTNSLNNLAQATQIELPNMNNISLDRDAGPSPNASKIPPTTHRISQKSSKTVFERRSPTSLSILSDHQINQQDHVYESSFSSTSNHQLINYTPIISCETVVTDEQQLIDGSSPISLDSSKYASSNDQHSQAGFHHKHAVISTSDTNYREEFISNSSDDEQSVSEIVVNGRNFSFSSNDQSFLNARLSLTVEKATTQTQDDNASIDYDTDDGWSDDSIELIYVDDRYLTQKERINSPSSSLQISEAHFSFHTQQKDTLLQE